MDDRSGAQVVSSFAFGRDILRSAAMRQAIDIGADRFDTSNPATTPVIFLDGDAHRRKRSAIAKFFTPKAMTTQYRGVMESTTDALIRSLQASGRERLDVISLELAVRVASEIVGLTNSNVSAMSRRIAGAFASGTTQRQNRFEKAIAGAFYVFQSVNFFYRDVLPAIKARRAARREDVISQLLDQGASNKTILIECMVYASAGMVTTREFIVMAAWHLFEHDELRKRFVESGEEEQLAILEEILRLDPVVARVYRRAAEEVAQTSQGPVAAGSHFAIDVRAVNTDESVIGSQPCALDPDRAGNAMGSRSGLSFGDGPHRCPGAQVALHESRVFLDRLFRVPGIRLSRAPDMIWNQTLLTYELRNAVVTCDKGGTA
jgi:cytochrome P450